MGLALAPQSAFMHRKCPRAHWQAASAARVLLPLSEQQRVPGEHSPICIPAAASRTEPCTRQAPDAGVWTGQEEGGDAQGAVQSGCGGGCAQSPPGHLQPAAE